jgi:hypothetical protein
VFKTRLHQDLCASASFAKLSDVSRSQCENDSFDNQGSDSKASSVAKTTQHALYSVVLHGLHQSYQLESTSTP